jgi:hypothetical protein
VVRDPGQNVGGAIVFGPLKRTWNIIYKFKPLQFKSELIKYQVS